MPDSRLSSFNDYVERKRSETNETKKLVAMRCFGGFTSLAGRVLKTDGVDETILCHVFRELFTALQQMWAEAYYIHDRFDPENIAVRRDATVVESCRTAMQNAFRISQAFAPDKAITEEETQRVVNECRVGFRRFFGEASVLVQPTLNETEWNYLDQFLWSTQRDRSVEAILDLCKLRRGVSKLIESLKTTNSKWLAPRSNVVGDWFAASVTDVIRRDANTLVSRYVDRAMSHDADAVESIDKAISINPACEEALICRSLVEKEFGKALARARRLVETSNSTHSKKMFCLAVAGRATELQAASKQRDALALVDEGIRHCPTNVHLVQLRLAISASLPPRTPGTIPKLP
jgi:hypothetical protein